jgi:hypothetical protein
MVTLKVDYFLDSQKHQVSTWILFNQMGKQCKDSKSWRNQAFPRGWK